MKSGAIFEATHFTPNNGTVQYKKILYSRISVCCESFYQKLAGVKEACC